MQTRDDFAQNNEIFLYKIWDSASNAQGGEVQWAKQCDLDHLSANNTSGFHDLLLTNKILVSNLNYTCFWKETSILTVKIIPFFTVLTGIMEDER